MSSFLQSPTWEEFQKSLGRKTWRAEGALVIRHDLPGGFNYLYCPRPESVTSNQLLVIKELARGEKSIFLKIDPAGPSKSDFLPSRAGAASAGKGPREVRLHVSEPLQPQKTVIIDLQQREEELLATMHEKTRYNIRLAERKKVSVSVRQNSGLADQWWAILQETAERDKFHTHPREHYEKLLSLRSPDFATELFLAEYNNKTVAGAIVNFYQDTAIYLHGASSREHREVMAPHLLHWRIIQEAKHRGFKYYDLWGIDEKKWPGVTRFKLGFGGEIVEYPESIDIVYRPPLYNLYRMVKHIRG